MPLKRQAFGTQTVILCITIAVGQEFAEMSAAYWAFHFVADIERTNQKAEQITQFDEPLAGENLCE